MSVWDERYRSIVEDDPEFKEVLELLSDKADAMIRFRKAAEDLGEYAAGLDDKLDAIRKWYALWNGCEYVEWCELREILEVRE